MTEEAVQGHGAVHNTVYATATLAITAVFTAALTFFLIRYLKPTDYGVFSIAISVGTIVALPADLGLSAATSRFVAENLHSRSKVAEILLGGLRLRVLSGLIGSAVLFALAGPIANGYDTPDLVLPIRLTALVILAQGLGGFFLGSFEAMRLMRTQFHYAIAESTTETAATVSLVLLGAGATGAVAGRAIGFTVGLVLIVVATVRLLGAHRIRAASGSHRQHFGRIARYGAALLIVDGAMTLFNRIDVLVIGAYKGTAAAGVFEAAMRLVTFLGYFGLALTPGFAPRLARVAGQEHDVGSFWKAFQAILLIQLLLLPAMLVWAEPVTRLAFGSEFEGSAAIFRALAPYTLLAGLAPLLSVGVNYLGEARRRVPLAIAAVTVNVVFDLIFVPKWGGTAGAIGSAIGFAIYVPGHLLICRAEVGMPTRALLLTTFRGLLAAAAAAAVLWAMGTESLSLAEWVGGFVLAPAAFLAVLIATGEVTIAQIRTGSEILRSRWENRG